MTDDELAELREVIEEQNPDALLADGFEGAILGIAKRCGQPALVAYDVDKCIAILIERDGMTWEEAQEFFQFNTAGAWVGEHTPVFIYRLDT